MNDIEKINHCNNLEDLRLLKSYTVVAMSEQRAVLINNKLKTKVIVSHEKNIRTHQL